MTFVFCGTVNAETAPPPEKPLSHYLAMATANTYNRIKTVGAYTEWVSKRVPPDQMKDFKAFLKQQGLKPSTKFPKMTAENDKACFDKDHCLTYTDDTVTINGATFKVEDKPFAKVVSDVCEKIGCTQKTANFSIIPQANAKLDQTTWTLLGLSAGGALGYFAAPSLGIKRSTGLLAGAIVGGLGAYLLSDEERAACGGGCTTTCSGQHCYMQPQPRPNPYPYFGQQQPPYHLPRQVHYRAYASYQPPCNNNTLPTYRETELQAEMRRRQSAPIYCNNVTAPCTQAPPYTPGACQYQTAQNHQQPPPADVRLIQSEPKKQSPEPKNK